MINKQTAGLLFGFGYQLQDKEGNLFDIYSVDGYRFYTYAQPNNNVFEIDFYTIGIDYFIRCRPLSSLTKPMENGEVPLINLANIFWKGQGWKISCGMTMTEHSLYSFRYDDSLNGFIYQHVGSGEITGLFNQEALFSKLYSYHFKPSALTDEMCVWI